MPAAIEAERAILGACMLTGQAPEIQADAFYHERHQLIAAAIQQMARKGIPIDLLTVWQALHTGDQLNAAGGAVYLAELLEVVPNADNLRIYEQIVQQKYHQRQIMASCATLASSSKLDPAQIISQLDTMQRAADRLCLPGLQQPMADACKHLVASMEQRRLDPGGLLGLPTGLADLDQALSGLCPSDLIVIAARAGMGKTAFAVNLAMSIAVACHSVQFFSLEMSREQLLYRMLANRARVDLMQLRSGNLPDAAYARAVAEIEAISRLPLLIDDTPSLTEVDIVSRTKRQEPGIIFVDYLQFVLPSARQERRDLEVALITRSLKSLAKELNIPVVLLAQLNRKLEERADKRPMLSDLRESGAIEQDADVVLFLYNDAEYDQQSPDRGIAELIIGKQRNGPRGTVPVAYDLPTTSFRNLASTDRQEFWQRKTQRPRRQS